MDIFTIIAAFYILYTMVRSFLLKRKGTGIFLIGFFF
jgi:hypothetical protein